jgi:hypothetical protein
MDEPLQTIADILDFPEPGTREHNQLRLRSYKNERVASWGVTETEIFDTAMSLHDKGLINIVWDGTEPMFEASQAGIDIYKPVQESD